MYESTLNVFEAVTLVMFMYAICLIWVISMFIKSHLSPPLEYLKAKYIPSRSKTIRFFVSMVFSSVSTCNNSRLSLRLNKK